SPSYSTPIRPPTPSTLFPYTTLFRSDADAVRRKFKRAVTDSGTEIRFVSTRPAINNLLTIYRLLTQKSPEEIEEHFAGKGYAQLKAELADITTEFLQPSQQRVRGIDDDTL